MTSSLRRNRRTTLRAASTARATRISVAAAFAALALAAALAAQQPTKPTDKPTDKPADKLTPVGAQPGRPGYDTLADQQYQIQLDVPSMERVLRLENDPALFERIRQEFRTRNDRAVFPAPAETETQPV